MADETEVIVGISLEMERTAARRARDKAKNARWDLNVLIFLFAILIMVIILATYTKAGLEVVAPVAIFGLAMVWLMGWRRGRQLYQRFYDEELLTTERELKEVVKGKIKEAVEETIEERVQRALRERWR